MSVWLNVCCPQWFSPGHWNINTNPLRNNCRISFLCLQSTPKSVHVWDFLVVAVSRQFAFLFDVKKQAGSNDDAEATLSYLWFQSLELNKDGICLRVTEVTDGGIKPSSLHHSCSSCSSSVSGCQKRVEHLCVHPGDLLKKEALNTCD